MQTEVEIMNPYASYLLFTFLYFVYIHFLLLLKR